MAGAQVMDTQEIALLLRGTVVTPRADRSLLVRENSLIGVDGKGFIAHFEAADTPASQELLSRIGRDLPRDCFVEIGKDGWILPGFVDTHIHAPQYIQAGLALDKPLMEWNGTTAASVFGTISTEANLVLAQAFLAAGLRGQIGKVAMDQNSIPSYIETTASSLADTETFIDKVRDLTAALPDEQRIVEPVVTPRFVPTCSIELMRGLATLAEQTGVRVQSHMCESQGMVEACREMLGGKSDVEVLDEVGLLHDRSLMAHCTHVSSADLARLSRTGTAVSHCPLSNVYFSAERQLPLREAWQAGVKVGLGSDISGGYRVGLDENMRWAVGISRLRQGQGQHLNAAEQGNNSVAITWQEALYLATLGGAQALGLDRERNVGTLEVGSAFDAQWIRVGGKGSRVEWFDLPDQDGQIKAVSVEEKLERWWCNGSEADRKAVWVQGRRVYTQET
ncbi:hypothetical protein C6P46_000571 [Rhodotorula mucilaginosa]|uniref:Amidohydrolase-related domain-containing protein n=1 Tax=Rhodotorula mucilaginosa TaxID=5537 RepID=A0A9P6VV63_RHOMI|nr:hypothetical protein C6P46_000571 [Rhodotorula mucilaginosa]